MIVLYANIGNRGSDLPSNCSRSDLLFIVWAPFKKEDYLIVDPLEPGKGSRCPRLSKVEPVTGEWTHALRLAQHHKNIGNRGMKYLISVRVSRGVGLLCMMPALSKLFASCAELAAESTNVENTDCISTHGAVLTKAFLRVF